MERFLILLIGTIVFFVIVIILYATGIRFKDKGSYLFGGGNSGGGSSGGGSSDCGGS